MKNNQITISEQKPQSNTDAMLIMIERIASSPDADISKMERLMEMRDKELARVARQDFSADYVLMKPKLPIIIKTKNNQQTKSKYAALEDINKIIDPILAEYNFSTSTRVISQSKESVTVEAVLWHKSGHTETTQVEMPLDKAGIQGTVNKTGVHALSSSITYAKRVAICALLNISTGDDLDGNQEPVDTLATHAQRLAMSNLHQKLNDKQKEWFDEKTGGLLNVKKADVNNVTAILNKAIAKKEQNNAA